MGKGLGSDNQSKQPVNIRAAQVVLHCNNCVILLVAIIIGVHGITSQIVTGKASLKFGLCEGSTSQLSSVITKVFSANSSAVFCAGASAGSVSSANEGHCNAHDDCQLGHYCDEDFVCWDCDYVMQYGDPENRDENYPVLENSETESGINCDAFDANSRPSGAIPCQRCIDPVTNPMNLRHRSNTQMRDVNSPEGAKFLGMLARVEMIAASVVCLNCLLGFFGDAYKRRTLLFVHFFVLLLLAVCMSYAVVFGYVFADTTNEMVHSYWPWIKSTFPRTMGVKEATNFTSHKVRGGIALFVLVSMSLWSGVVASARLLGMKYLAKQMLIATNLLVATVGATATIAAINYSLAGYSWGIVGAIGALGAVVGGLGMFGFVGAYTEREGLLKAQMCCTYPTAFILFLLGLDCVFWDKLDLKAAGHNAVRRKLPIYSWAKMLRKNGLGRMSNSSAIQLLQSHYILLGLFVVLVAILIVANLCFTRLLVQRIALDGRGGQYSQVSAEDLDDDFGDGGDVSNDTYRRNRHNNFEMATFEIGDDDEQGP